MMREILTHSSGIYNIFRKIPFLFSNRPIERIASLNEDFRHYIRGNTDSIDMKIMCLLVQYSKLVTMMIMLQEWRHLVNGRE